MNAIGDREVSEESLADRLRAAGFVAWNRVSRSGFYVCPSCGETVEQLWDAPEHPCLERRKAPDMDA